MAVKSYCISPLNVCWHGTLQEIPSSDIVLFVHGLHIVGTRSFDRIRLAMVDGGQALHVLFDKI